MEPAPRSTEQVSSAVKQHEAMQDNFEQVLNQQPNPPPYPQASAGAQYGGHYGDQYGVSSQPVVSSEVHVFEGHQQVSGSKCRSWSKRFFMIIFLFVRILLSCALIDK